MALWHFMQGSSPYSWIENGLDVSSFDDGLDFIPGEDGFNSSAADAFAAALGADPAVMAVYTGTPGYAARIAAEDRAREQAKAEAEVQAQAEAEARAKAQAEAEAQAYADALAEAEAQEKAQAKAKAEALIDAMLNPPSPLDLAKAKINEQYDGLLVAAPDRADDIAKLRDAALAAAEASVEG